jgi:hypothetical protein
MVRNMVIINEKKFWIKLVRLMPDWAQVVKASFALTGTWDFLSLKSGRREKRMV